MKLRRTGTITKRDRRARIEETERDFDQRIYEQYEHREKAEKRNLRKK